MMLHAFFALMLLVGYRVRLATVACIVFQVNLGMRNPVVAHSGYALLVWLLCWALFLPVGGRASVEALTSRAAAPEETGPPPAPPSPPVVRSVASMAMLLQVAMIYWCSVAARTSADWWGDFAAVQYALLGPYGKPLGRARSSPTRF